MSAENFADINRRLWNEKTKHHVDSEFYDVAGFLKGRNSLNEIELELLGDVTGKKILHLQCHFGQDSLSLARMGAKVTGADLSDESIKQAQHFAKELSLDASFVCCNIYDLKQHLDDKFDIVFTSYGTIGWLPDLTQWANIITHYLKPGGKFIMADFHPVMWMFDNEFKTFEYSYFKKEAIVETLKGTYADREAEIELQEIGWNHSLDELLQNLIDAGLQLEIFKEVDHSPYNCFSKTVEVSPGKYQIAGMEGKLPMVYGIRAGKD